MPRSVKSARRTRAPLQARSLRTQERLLEALESLLEERDIRDISVDDIVERAHVSVGAFYKRFASRQDLLLLLLTRVQEGSQQFLQQMLHEPGWRGRGLAERIDALIDTIAEAHVRRRRVIAALVAGKLTSSFEMSSQDIAVARANMASMCKWLLACREEIRHDRPELAVRVGLYLCLQALQAALLFETRASDVPRQMVVEEAKRMLRRYLTGMPD